MRSPFSIKWIYLIERRSFDQKYKFSNKNDMASAWRNFKNIFPRPFFIIIFRPEMLEFHPYSILTGDTRVEFVIYCVLILFVNWQVYLTSTERPLKLFSSFLEGLHRKPIVYNNSGDWWAFQAGPALLQVQLKCYQAFQWRRM